MVNKKYSWDEMPELMNRMVNEMAELKDVVQHLSSPKIAQPADLAPILSSAQIKEMTGWPSGTFYAKVAQMPQGVVIRGRSKRLLFDREKFVQWLKTPVEP